MDTSSKTRRILTWVLAGAGFADWGMGYNPRLIWAVGWMRNPQILGRLGNA